MAQAKRSTKLEKTIPARRRFGTIAGLLLMGASLAASGCDLPEDGSVQAGVADPGFSPGADSGVLMLPNATVLLDRPDLVAVAPAGVDASQQAIQDIQDQFPGNTQRALQGKIQVVYLGPINFDLSRDDGARSGTVNLQRISGYATAQALPGHRVMWANFETGNLFLINYPLLSGVNPSLPALEDYDPVPIPDMSNPVDSDSDIDWLRSRRYRHDAQGVLSGYETRERVYEPNAPVEGSYFKRHLSLGGATGAMIGSRHFMTAAQVLVQHDEHSGRIKLFDVAVHPARNGNSQIGESARVTQLWWMADWNPTSAGTKRRSYDMAWGVLDRAVGEETGYFGLMSSSAQQLRALGLPLNNAGYSDCASTSAPVPPGCLRRHIYGDSQDCNILGETERDLFGWGQAVAHGCDANRGQGGSPLVATRDGRHYIWAVHSGSTHRVNYASRLTPARQRYLMSGMFARFPRDAS